MPDPLTEAAGEVRARAWAPYSGFSVGAALEAEDGRVFTGCNVESAAPGAGLCAERSALAAAVGAGARRFRRLVVVAGSEPPVAPCGVCRQALAEFGLELIVEGVGPTGSRRWTLRELLPDPFGPELARGRTVPVQTTRQTGASAS